METYLPDVITAINKCLETHGNDVSAETIAKALKPYIKSKKACKDPTEHSINKRIELYYIEWYESLYERKAKFGVVEVMAIKRLIKTIQVNILLSNNAKYDGGEYSILQYLKDVLSKIDYFPQFIKKNPTLTTIETHFNTILADVRINYPKGFKPTETEPFFNGNSNSKALSESRFNDAMQ